MSSGSGQTGQFAQLPESEPYPGVFRRRFDAEGATVAAYRFDPGATFPLHQHPEEQITLIEEGEVEFTVGDATEQLRDGSWSIVPPSEPHQLRAGADGARILAIVVPRRRGSVGYTVIDQPEGT